MALSPIPAALICTVAYSAQALMLGSGAVSVDTPSFDDGSGGVFDFIVGVFDWIGQAVAFLVQFLSFNLLGMPWFLGVPMSVFCVGSISWSLFELGRGT